MTIGILFIDAAMVPHNSGDERLTLNVVADVKLNENLSLKNN